MSTTVLIRTGRAEWSRIWSVRSSWIFALVTAVAVVGLGTIIGSDTADDPAGVPPDASAWNGGQITGMFVVLLVAAASVAVWAFLPELGLPVGDGAEILGGLGFVYASGALLAVGLGLVLRSTAGGLVTVIALVLVLPMLLAQLPYDWAVNLSALMPGSGALYLIFGEGPSDDMTNASSRLTLAAAWAVTALLAGDWRLLRTDPNR